MIPETSFTLFNAEGLKWGDGGRGGVGAPTEESAAAEAVARAEEWRGSRSEADSKGGKRDIFLNPFEAKRLNRNFPLSGAMQGPRHFLCFALMCLQREEGRLNTALPHARKHSSATFSWLRFTVDLCARDTERQKQQPAAYRESPHACGHRTFERITPDPCEPPHSKHIGVLTCAHLLCFYLEFGRVSFCNFP